MSRTVRAARYRALIATAVAAVVASLAYAPLSDASAASPKLADGAKVSSHPGSLAKSKASPAKPRVLGGTPAGGEPGSSTGLPEGVPTSGTYAFLLKLGVRPTMAAYNSASSASGGKAAAKAQLAAIRSQQNLVVSALPAHSSVLYKTHAVLSGVAVSTDVANYQALRAIRGVVGVYPIAPKSPSNSYAVPLQRAPQAWHAHGDLGENSSVAIIDTGVDYTHANMGGVGTVAEFKDSQAQLGEPVSPDEFPGPKVVGGFDLAGDNYQAGVAGHDPAPDPYPLDCNGHGSHVAGTVAGYGENADGSTYTGAYNNNTPFSAMRIGPGMAPEAKLYAFRVFGCEGSTNLVADAIDMAADPDGNGDPSDHVDVVNMSLGFDFGSPQDGDSVASEAASDLGITMVIASGNAGDLYDAGGSPGDAVSPITVAASTDNYAQVDSLDVSGPASIAGSYAAERSVAYDWVNDPDLSGTVAQVTDPTNLDGCAPLSPTDAAAVNGKIAFVEWTDDDTVRRCGSAGRAANLVAAGATGFIYADDSESFAAGITGSAVIPGVLVAQSGGDAIRSELTAGHTVTIASTTPNGFSQFSSGRDDLVASFSSRGIGDVDNVKPDVSAVGETVFSTGSGTGNEGLNDSGTSMATPMVAGTAALVKSLHGDWTPEQVKADIMNTAQQDLFTDNSHTGDKYAPQRVGSGRIDVKRALDNEVLAYNADVHGAVSLSFGPLEVTEPTTLEKTIKVENTGPTSRTYDVSFANRTKIPGADYSVSPSSVTVGPNASDTVTVTLEISPEDLTKTIDPTVDRFQGGLPRVYQADASGLVMLKSPGTSNLSVPVYAAPRPASQMTQASSLTLPEGAHQSALLPLTGTGVSQGSGAKSIDSLVAGFELSATSPAIPVCDPGDTDCIDFTDEGSADIRSVGITSDAAQVTSLGGDPATEGTTYIAVQVNHPWRTPAGIQEFDIYLDTNRDGDPDFVMFNTRLTGTDILVAETIDLSSGDVADLQIINSAFGDTDTALLQSSVLVMPVANASIGIDPSDSRLNYGVLGFTAYQGPALDAVGFDADDAPALGFDPLNPGAAVYGSVDPSSSWLLFNDNPGSVLKVDREAASYAADGAQGLMMVHFHNQEADKVQVVSLNKNESTTGLVLDPTTIAQGASSTATVTVTGEAAGTPTGQVTLKDGASVLGTTAVDASGVATFTVTPTTAGTHDLTAAYAGDDNYAGSSASGTLTVTAAPPPAKVTPTVSLSLDKSSVKRRHKVHATIGVTGTAGTATGTVELGKVVGGTFKVLASGTLSNGTLTLTYVPTKKGHYHLQARYTGDSAYNTASSAEVKLKVTKK